MSATQKTADYIHKPFDEIFHLCADCAAGNGPRRPNWNPSMVTRIGNETNDPCQFCDPINWRKAKKSLRQKARREIRKSGICPRCNGKGYIEGYSHIENGICFQCEGAGKTKGEK